MRNLGDSPMNERKTGVSVMNSKKIWTAPALQIIALSSAAAVGTVGKGDAGHYPTNKSA
jgi:hypothetical protein